ncbi:hypothetical protein EVAR_54870_1 [Eumeta japonica]|uniref:52 kDa repressor of the inhibitor of the protein kinase n=1 Tax=Eumeta variegata TaxID=151549 RepID=A0A4C1YCS4_EUMVA|nr:hypothetical protein EVAR_54870_1 [Eumeta japonica]
MLCDDITQRCYTSLTTSTSGLASNDCPGLSIAIVLESLILVTLPSERHRDDSISAVPRYNRNQSSPLTSAHLSIHGDAINIYVSEHLPPHTKKIHAAARKVSKESGYKYTWLTRIKQEVVKITTGIDQQKRCGSGELTGGRRGGAARPGPPVLGGPQMPPCSPYQIDFKNELNIQQQLKKYVLDIALCRAQGYDSAASTSGLHGGVERKIREVNPKALFSSCSNHSLNLCGVHAFACVSSSVKCFGTVEKLYSLFSSPTQKWRLLKEKTGKKLKRLSDTRWNAHYKSVKVVKENIETIVSSLKHFQDPTKANLDTKSGANLLLPAVCDFTFLAYIQFCLSILKEVNLVQQYLQSPKMTLDTGIIKLNALNEYLVTERTTIVDNAVTFGMKKCNDMDINVEKRGRRKIKRTMPGESAHDAGLSIQEEIQASDDALAVTVHNLIEIYGELEKEQVSQKGERVCILEYLFTNEGKRDRDIERRVNAGNEGNEALLAITNRESVSRQARLTIHNKVLIPTLMYDSESWVWQKKNESRINAAEMRSLLSMCGVSREDRCRNSDVRELCFEGRCNN